MHLTAIAGNTGLGATSGSSSTSSAASTIDQQFASLLQSADEDSPEATLEALTKDGVKGYWSWKIEEMKKKITKDVMEAENITPEKLAAMPEKERIDLESKIMKEVEAQLKLAITEEMKNQTKKHLDTASTLTGMLSAQEV